MSSIKKPPIGGFFYVCTLKYFFSVINSYMKWYHLMRSLKITIKIIRSDVFFEANPWIKCSLLMCFKKI